MPIEKNRPHRTFTVALLLLLLLLGLTWLVESMRSGIHFDDPRLDRAVREKLGKRYTPLYITDLLQITHLDASGRGIRTLGGIERLHRLEELDLSNNLIADLSPLQSLQRLTRLNLQYNIITDLNPLEGQTSLQSLNLRQNKITDITPLVALRNLTYLNLHSNSGIQSLAPIATLQHLETLILRNVPVGADMEWLRDLHQLKTLNIRNCGVTDPVVLINLMKNGALQDIPDQGVEASLNIMDNPIDWELADNDALMCQLWSNIRYRWPIDEPPPCVTPAPEFSIKGGLYDEGFDLILSHPSTNATLLYTLDGSEPEPKNLNGSTYQAATGYARARSACDETTFVTREMRTHRYKGPISIPDHLAENRSLTGINTVFSCTPVRPQEEPFRGTVVRARAFEPSKLPSLTETHTYLILPDIQSRYSVPVISIVVPEASFFGYNNGIYVPGRIADEWHKANPDAQVHWSNPANFNWRGAEEGERRAHIEVFAPNGSFLYRDDIGIRIHGQSSRNYPLKSLRIIGRQRWGGQGYVPFESFPDFKSWYMNQDAPRTYSTLILRNSGNDHAHAYYRDAFLQSLVAGTRLDTQAYQLGVHFLNGVYWGLINVRERYDPSYLKSRYHVAPENVSILYCDHRSTSGILVKHGSYDDAEDFLDFVSEAESGVFQEREQELIKKIDIEQLFLMYALQIYSRNHDWPQDNCLLWRVSEIGDITGSEGASNTTRWRFLMMDMDFGFGLSPDSELGGHVADNSLARVVHLTDEPNVWRRRAIKRNPVNRLFRALVLEDLMWQQRFLVVLSDLLNDQFEESRVLRQLNDFEQRIAPLRAEHNARWQVDTAYPAVMEEFAMQRPRIVRDHAVDAFGLSGTFKLIVQNSYPERGDVRVNSILLSTKWRPYHAYQEFPLQWTGVYFADLPLTLEALPQEGYTFIGWKAAPMKISDVEDIESSERVWSARFDADHVVKPVFVPLKPQVKP